MKLKDQIEVLVGLCACSSASIHNMLWALQRIGIWRYWGRYAMHIQGYVTYAVIINAFSREYFVNNCGKISNGIERSIFSTHSSQLSCEQDNNCGSGVCVCVCVSPHWNVWLHISHHSHSPYTLFPPQSDLSFIALLCRLQGQRVHHCTDLWCLLFLKKKKKKLRLRHRNHFWLAWQKKIENKNKLPPVQVGPRWCTAKRSRSSSPRGSFDQISDLAKFPLFNCSPDCAVAFIAILFCRIKKKKKVGYPWTHRRPAPETSTARAFEGERDALFHFRAHNFIYFNLENEGLFSKFPPRSSWWEVLCHSAGMCKLFHPSSSPPPRSVQTFWESPARW